MYIYTKYAVSGLYYIQTPTTWIQWSAEESRNRSWRERNGGMREKGVWQRSGWERKGTDDMMEQIEEGNRRMGGVESKPEGWDESHIDHPALWVSVVLMVWVSQLEWTLECLEEITCSLPTHTHTHMHMHLHLECVHTCSQCLATSWLWVSAPLVFSQFRLLHCSTWATGAILEVWWDQPLVTKLISLEIIISLIITCVYI